MIAGYDGTAGADSQRFFKGADSFRGFALAGVGPRDLVARHDTTPAPSAAMSIAIGTFAARLPTLLPESYGVSLGLFTDFGTVGRIDNVQFAACTHRRQSCIKDNLAFRASAGISVKWKSPFGPVQIDLGLPIVKTEYDRPQIIHFSGATGAKPMKKTLALSLALFAVSLAPVMAAPPRRRRRRVPAPKILVIDRAAILRFSKVGQDVTSRSPPTATRPRTIWTARPRRCRPRARHCSSRSPILAPDVKAQKIKDFETKQAALQDQATRKEQMIQYAMASGAADTSPRP